MVHYKKLRLNVYLKPTFETTEDILNNNRYSTKDKFDSIIDKVHQFTGLDVSNELRQILAFDAFILNKDRHTNNILFLFEPKSEVWQLAPIFDNGLSLLSDVKDYPQSMPLNILKRKVKAKPFNSSFTKQLSLYQGGSFINRSALLKDLEETPYPLDRAKEVVLSQLSDSSFQGIIFNEEGD